METEQLLAQILLRHAHTPGGLLPALCFGASSVLMKLAARAGVPLVPLALWLGDSGLERALLIAVWLLVLMFELVNSAIEAVVDRIGPEQHTLSGRAKDIGSAVVLVALINAALVWSLVLLGRG